MTLFLPALAASRDSLHMSPGILLQRGGPLSVRPKFRSFSTLSAPISASKYASAFFKIYQIIKLNFFKFAKILQNVRHLQIFAEVSEKLLIFQTDFC